MENDTIAVIGGLAIAGYLVYRISPSISSGIQTISTGIGSIGTGTGTGINNLLSGTGSGINAIGQGTGAIGYGAGSLLSQTGGGIYQIGQGVGNIGTGTGNAISNIGTGLGNLITGTSPTNLLVAGLTIGKSGYVSVNGSTMSDIIAQQKTTIKEIIPVNTEKSTISDITNLEDFPTIIDANTSTSSGGGAGIVTGSHNTYAQDHPVNIIQNNTTLSSQQNTALNNLNAVVNKTTTNNLTSGQTTALNNLYKAVNKR